MRSSARVSPAALDKPVKRDFCALNTSSATLPGFSSDRPVMYGSASISSRYARRPSSTTPMTSRPPSRPGAASSVMPKSGPVVKRSMLSAHRAGRGASH